MASRKKLTKAQELELVRAHVHTLSEKAWRNMASELHLQARDMIRLRRERDLPRIFKLETEVVPALVQRIEALEGTVLQLRAEIQDLRVSQGNALAPPALVAPPQGPGPVPQCQSIEDVQALLDWWKDLSMEL